ncbi:MAG: hypothetical protein KGI59_01535 [Patescibacteria group bacterium]|nr:hypothetical protein [Patescibacteria group bacterium]MDE2172634.1 hypothetical protein [Patescibacteria group bacterium]
MDSTKSKFDHSRFEAMRRLADDVAAGKATAEEVTWHTDQRRHRRPSGLDSLPPLTTDQRTDWFAQWENRD